MKRLLLLRHAKAVPGGAKNGDHGRGLNDRGRSDAPRVGAEMQHRGYRPDVVLCSTAKRTVETWQRVVPELDGKPEVDFIDALYLAPSKVIANLVRAVAEPAGIVLVIGHNPGLEDCARSLARTPHGDEERRRLETMAEKFPTCALAVLDFEVATWDEMEAGAGQLVDFLRPRVLTGG
jgi:phosphohistidine phosphatase